MTTIGHAVQYVLSGWWRAIWQGSGSRQPEHSALGMKKYLDDSNPGDPYPVDLGVAEAGSESESKLLLQIYALTKDNISRVIQDMDDLWKHESTCQILESEEDKKNIEMLSHDDVGINIYTHHRALPYCVSRGHEIEICLSVVHPSSV